MNIMMLPVTPDGKPAGEAMPYLQKPGVQREGHFSPDGGWVAYEESAESGQSEVFIDTFPERHRATQISTNGGFGARWNPAGWRSVLPVSGGQADGRESQDGRQFRRGIDAA